MACLALWAGALLSLLLVGAGPAQAHPMPESRAWLDTTDGGLRLTLLLPLNRLELAFGQPLADAPSQVLPQHAQGLSAYLLQHVGARSDPLIHTPGDTLSWQVLRPQLAVLGEDRAAELQAVFELRAPAGADRRRVTLLLDAITHEVRTHRVRLFLRQDWAGGQAGGVPQALGEWDHSHRDLLLSLPPTQGGGEGTGSFASLFRSGVAHIADGTDHLLFLLTLLLAAPWRAEGRRWTAPHTPAAAARQAVAVVTAFTVGHSLTLVLASMGVLAASARWVEPAVALSIAVAALHAWRPLWQEGERWLAGGFGLLHGLAFAANLQGAGLTPGQYALALLAFNLGIEAVQLLVVLIVMPALLLLAWKAPQAQARLRPVLALAAGAVALHWLAERVTTGPAVDAAGAAAVAMLAVLQPT